MAKRRCAACGCLFVPRRNVPDQRYCSERACQRARRRRWQRQKLKADADYRANQAAAQRRWRERHPDYWRRYRQRHPDSTERNRQQQRERNRRRRLAATGPSPPTIAKMDECTVGKAIVSGTYRLIPVTGSGLAKMDAYMVKMQVISAT
jgi:hypothetical protein